MDYLRFFIHLYFHQTTFDFKAVALPTRVCHTTRMGDLANNPKQKR